MPQLYKIIIEKKEKWKKENRSSTQCSIIAISLWSTTQALETSAMVFNPYSVNDGLVPSLSTFSDLQIFPKDGLVPSFFDLQFC